MFQIVCIYSISLWAWWRHQMETFSALLALCVGNSPVPVNSPHKGQWRGALMFSLISAWINEWVNNRQAGDLRRHRGHYDVIVMGSNYWIVLVIHDCTCVCTYVLFTHILPGCFIDTSAILYVHSRTRLSPNVGEIILHTLRPRQNGHHFPADND